MSTTIDQRVVEMQFDNRRFEQNVKTSMSTIDKLKQSLNLTGAAKGFEEIDSISRKINFSAMGNAVEAVQAKFSALQIMGITALTNITNSAVNAGKRIASALTIDPIKTGFSEYETQINAVQTILANTESKGTTLQDVNSALDTLNTYADKTIYNFTEMTKNIGTFTAAGIDLDTSVGAIQGIANLAAVSGSNSEQASRAMYQLSQALSAGTLKLMDWNSVVNAGMGGEVFRKALVQTAQVVHATNSGMKEVVNNVAKDSSYFRDSLQNGWITSEVLTKTLEQFTMAAEEGSDAWNNYKKSLMDEGYTEKQAIAILKMANTATDAATKVKTFTQLWDTLKESAQSGWTQTWEIIMGDFGESKEFLTKVSNTIGGMIGESAEARNSLLSGGLSTGWKQLLGAGIADESGYTDTLKTVAKEHGVSIDDMIKKEKELDDSLSDGDAFQKALKKGLADGTLNSNMLSESVDKMATKMSKMSAKEREAAGYTVEHVEQIKKLNEGLKNGTISMDEFTKKIIRPSGRENIIESLWNAFEGLMSVIKPIKEAFREVFPPMTSEQLYQMTVNLKEFTSRLKLSDENAEKLKTAFKGLFSVIDIGVTFIKDLLGGAVKLIKNFTGLGGCILDNASSLGEWLINLHDSVTASDAFGKTIDKIVDFLSKGITAIKNFGKSIADNFKMPDLSGFLGIMQGVWQVISYIGSAIGRLLAPVGKAIAMLFEGASAFDVLESGLLAGSFVGITKMAGGFEEIFDKVKGFTDIFGEDGALGGIKQNVTDVLDRVRGCLETWQQNVQASILMKIAGAIAILAASIFVISRIDKDSLDKSLGAITMLFVELIGALTIFTKMDLNGIKGAGKTVATMIGMSVSILILASALKKLSSLSWEQIGKGLVGVGALMLELSLFMSFTKFNKKFKSTATGIILLSAALLIMVKAVEAFSVMKWEQIGRGLAAIGGLLLELGLFTKLTGNAKHVTATGLSMIALGAALKIFASALKDFSKMSWEQIGRGLTSMAGALTEITLALNLMPKNIAGKGVGLIAVGAALHILASALDAFQMMSWEEIGRGLAAMGGALIILGSGLRMMTGTLSGSASLIVATIALAGLVPVLKVLGGMSWSEIGKGLLTIAGSIAIIGAAGYLLGPVVPAILGLAGAIVSIGLSVVAFGTGLTLIGVGLTAIGTGITALSTSLAAGATALVAGLTVIIVGVLDLIPTIISKIGEGVVVLCRVIAECAPEIAKTVLVVISEVLSSLATYAPQIVDSIFTFVVGLLDVFAERLPELIQVAVKVIAAFFQGVVDALSGIDTTNLLKGIAGIGLLTGLMIALSAAASFVPGAMAGVLGMGIVIAEMAAILAAIGGIAQIPGLSWLISEGGNFLQTIGTAIGQFIGGIAGGIAQGITASLPQMGTDLANFMTNVQPFIDGAKSIDSTALEGVKTLVGVILGLTAANVLDGLTSWFTGGASLSKFGTEIAAFGPHIKAYADAVAGIDAETVTASANAAKALAQMTSYIPNEGGIVAWFTGENSISKFGAELVTLGLGLKAYSMSIVGFNAEAVIASANAAKALADMTSHIPNQGGMVAWFTGENSVSKFSSNLVTLAVGLKAYSMAIVGFNAEAVTASINAAKAIADMTAHIPNEGGLVAWFTGENSVAKFASQLPVLGMGLGLFSQSVAGINSENMIAATSAAKALADMANTIPNEGGMVAWFTGENSVAKFASQLPILGMGLNLFSTSVAGINADNITAAANSAKALAEMAQIVPSEGGIKAWFTGENAVSKFASQLPTLGEGLSGFSESVAGIIPENITAAASAAKSLAQMADTTPKNTSKIIDFGTNLATFGTKLKSYFDNTSNITKDAISLSEYALNSIKKSTSGFESATINTAASAIKTMVDAIKKMAKVKASDVHGFNDALKKIGVSNVKTITTTFEDASPKLLKAGKELIGEFVKGVDQKKSDVKKSGQKALEQFIDGIESKESTAKNACKDAVSACAKAMSNSTNKFSTVGKNLVQGFADGISANTYLATAKARAMANAAEKAAKEALDINSPSKVFRSIGYSVPEGFAMGIDKMRSMVTDSSAGMAESAINNVKTSISRMADIINSDIDSQPTIRPVVDLSSVKAGADSINGMFSDGITIDTSHVNRISTLMNQRNQNGANDDIVSAINKLRKDLGNVGNTSYNLNGLTYNEGSDVAEAFKTIIRAATMERRV